MTAETSTTISSISSGNLNISGGTSKTPNSVSIGGGLIQNANKRGFQFETDKIENLQLSEQQNTASPSAFNKVSSILEKKFYADCDSVCIFFSARVK